MRRRICPIHPRNFLALNAPRGALEAIPEKSLGFWGYAPSRLRGTVKREGSLELFAGNLENCCRGRRRNSNVLRDWIGWGWWAMAGRRVRISPPSPLVTGAGEPQGRTEAGSRCLWVSGLSRGRGIGIGSAQEIPVPGSLHRENHR